MPDKLYQFPTYIYAIDYCGYKITMQSGSPCDCEQFGDRLEPLKHDDRPGEDTGYLMCGHCHGLADDPIHEEDWAY